VDAVKKQQFWPDTISTDWGTTSRSTGVIDLPNCMSKLLVSGMPLTAVIAAATATPSRIFPVFKGRGTLKVGAPGDVAILDLRSGKFEFEDNYDNKIPGSQRLFPSMTVVGGKLVAKR
jgi:dihydroorotase